MTTTTEAPNRTQLELKLAPLNDRLTLLQGEREDGMRALDNMRTARRQGNASALEVAQARGALAVLDDEIADVEGQRAPILEQLAALDAEVERKAQRRATLKGAAQASADIGALVGNTMPAIRSTVCGSLATYLAAYQSVLAAQQTLSEALSEIERTDGIGSQDAIEVLRSNGVDIEQSNVVFSSGGRSTPFSRWIKPSSVEMPAEGAEGQLFDNLVRQLGVQ